MQTEDGLTPTHVYRLYRPYRRALPQAELFCERWQPLPFYPDLGDDEVDRICDLLRRFLQITVRVGLAWIDDRDPTDLAVASGLRRALAALGHEALVVGPRSPQAGSPGALARWAERRGVDVWHLHVFGRSHRLFARAVEGDGRPLVSTLHLILPDYLEHAGGRALLGRLLRRSSAVTAVSRASLAQARVFFPATGGRLAVVPNGAGEAAPAAGVDVPRPYVLCPARLAPYKGQDALLMAFALARERFPGLRLALCGRDQLGGRLRAFARRLGLGESVVFLGQRSPGQVARLRRRAAFVALPSRRENFPLALLEAMRDGKAAVATRTGGVPEMARHGREALLVAPGDAAGLADALARLAGDGACAGGSARRRGAAARRGPGKRPRARTRGSMKLRLGEGLVLAPYAELSRGPDAWDNDSSPAARRRLEAAAAMLGAGPVGRLLDVGCGDGRFLGRVASRARSVTGIDLSAEGVARARARVRGYPGARVTRGNFLARPPRGRFDIVCCLRVLADFEPPVQTRFLDKLLDAAAEDGRLLLMVPARRFRLFTPRVFLAALKRRCVIERTRRLRAEPPRSPLRRAAAARAAAMSRAPAVSVVMPFLNAGRRLAASTASVLRQTFGDWELLLVDGGSTDGSAAFARALARREAGRVRVLRWTGERPLRIFRSRLWAARRARARVIALLDSDDEWQPGYLERRLRDYAAAFGRAPGLLFGPAIYLRGPRPGLQPTPRPGLYPPGALVRRFLSADYALTPCASGAVLARSIVLSAAPLARFADDNAVEDQYLWSHAALRYPIRVCRPPLFWNTLRPGSTCARARRHGTYREQRGRHERWLLEELGA